MNLFELFVKIGVDDQASGKLSDLSSKLGNGLKTAAKIGTAAVGAAAAGITALTTAAVNNYAEYEQLAGGIETLFEDLSWDVGQNAAKAFQTAGLSANEYMSTAMSFAASLNQSLTEMDGNIARSADLTDQAILDMADNANKMGSDMSTLQTAYAGFAKQNYTLLDNLKIGYGGTKEEMQRLIADAAKLSDTVDAQSMSFANIVEAIHVVQTEMGITGTTAKEAASTISGSVSSMKSAWSNLVTGIADENAEFGTLVNNFVESASTVLDNILPRIEESLYGVDALIYRMFPIIMERIPKIISDFLPRLVETATMIVQSIVDGISENQEMLMTTAMETITYLATSLISMLPEIVALGLDLIVSLANGISQNLGTLIPTIVDVVLQIVDTLTSPETLSNLLDAAMTLIESIVTGLIDNIPQLVEAAIEIVQNLVDFITKPGNLQKLLQMALELVITIMEGIIDAIPQLTTAAIELVMQLVKFILDPGNIAILLQMSLEIVLAIVDGLLAASGELINGAVELITELCNTFLETDWAQIGSDIINILWSGLQSAWESVSSWFNGVWDSLFGNRSVDVNANVTGGVSTDGSHAGGLAYVPFDGYIAELHKGERVLTADEARGYNNRSNSGYDERPIKIVVQSVLDGKVIGETAYNYNRRKARAGGT